LPTAVYATRIQIINEAITLGDWPSTTQKRLSEVESAAWAVPADAASNEETTPKVSDSSRKRNLSGESNVSKSSRQSSGKKRKTSDKSGSEKSDKSSTQATASASKGKSSDKLPSKSSQKKKTPPKKSQSQHPSADSWQSSMAEQMNSLALLVQQLSSRIPGPKPAALGRNPDNDIEEVGPNPNDPSILVDKNEVDEDEAELDGSDHPFDDENDQYEDADEGQPPEGQDQDVSLSLNLDSDPVAPSVQKQGRRPISQFPRIPRRDPSILDDDPGADTEHIDLSRLQKRRMYVNSLPNLVPQLKHAAKKAEPISQHFGMLDVEDKAPRMPFLPQIFEQCNKWADEPKKLKDPFKKLPRYYPTTQPAEGSLLSPRTVPREILQYAVAANLESTGSSGNTAVIKRDTDKGAREVAAIQSYSQACGYLRLSNNMELGIQICDSMLTKISSFADRIDASKLPAEQQIYIDEIKKKASLMKKAVFDLSSCNSDFLKCSTFQYQAAMLNRREAWVATTSFPQGTVNELRNIDLPRVDVDSPPTRVSLYGGMGSSVLEEYHAVQKERRAMGNGPRFSRPFNRNNQSNRRFYPQNKGRGRGHSFRGQNQGRGQPRGGRGRGRARGGHGQNQQPFSQGQNQSHKD
jgi:hypothetical protein